jgi:gas vesicle protein
MADEKKYDKARELAEDALKKAVDGDDKAADKLAQEAKATDPQAVEDVLQELDEDVSSEHDPEKIKQELGNDANEQ